MRRFATVFALLLLLVARPAAAEPSHGVSAFGSLKYPADFTHFDYVRPDAPKGGELRLAVVGTFDSVNQFILKGTPVVDFGGVYDTLMARAADEPDSYYGLIAESAEVAGDGRAIVFNLRPQARFHDSSPITAEDVAFTFGALTSEGHPQWRILYRDVAGVEVLDRHRVRFTFKDSEALRDLPLNLAQMPVLSKRYYEAHKFAETTLAPPLGSGPYRVDDVKPGRAIVFRRVEDYWAADLAVNRGRWNFDVISFDYYRDRTAELLAFFAGAYDFREEFTSKSWMTEYDDKTPIRQGLIVRQALPDETPSGVQAFFFNTRRAQFADPVVRHALAYAFDFEWTNKTIFYGLYERTTSMFENSELRHQGPPGDAELALLEPYRDRLPPEVFKEAYQPPKTDGTGNPRANLRAARKRLADAGWQVRDGVLRDAAGTALTIEFLIFEPTFERVIGPYVQNLKRLGIAAGIRTVDAATFQRRVRDFDFDVVTARFAMRETPGTELYNYFGGANANTPGSLNYAGIDNPVVDDLIGKVIGAESRQALLDATRALDRVLMWNHYTVPQWYKGLHHIAFWNKFSRPKVKPRFARGVLDTWWFDEQKAALTAAGQPAPSD